MLSGELCLPGCLSDAQCLPSETCDRVLAACVARTSGVPPRILRFTVTPEVIQAAGDLVTFEYQVEGATQVEISPGALAATGAASMVFNHPVSETTTFVLTATGEGTTTQERTVTLSGSTGGPLEIRSFTATPEAVGPAQAVTLAWNVVNAAPGKIRVSDPGARRYLVEGAPASGTTTDNPRVLPVEYWLDAEHEDGTILRARVEVLAAPLGPVAITKLEATPATIEAGDTALVRWETRNGAQLELTGGPHGPFRSQDPFEVARGFRLVAPEETTPFGLELSGAGGATARAETTITVARAGVPSFTRAEISPERRTGGGGTTSVVVTWETAGADRVFLVPDEAVIEELAPNDRREVALGEGNLPVTLIAERDGSTAIVQLTSWLVTPEQEPNGTPGYADDATDSARSGTLSAFETDMFSLRVEEGGSIVARLGARGSQGPGGCGGELTRATFTLLGPDGQSDLAHGSVTPEGCQELEARHLPAGEYYLLVDGRILEIGLEYTVYASVLGAICGDLWTEAEEQCDDGNRLAGDGCDGLCRLEVSPSYDVTTMSGDPPLPLVPEQPVLLGPDGSATLALPFPFVLFGRSYAGVVAYADGHLGFRPVEEGRGPPSTLPSVEAPNAVIAPFWSSLRLADFPGATGELTTWAIGRGALPGRFFLAFRNLTGAGHTADDHVLLNALVVLEEETHLIRVYYGEISVKGRPSDLTVFAGIEDAKGVTGVSVPGCEQGCRPDRGTSGTLVLYAPKN